jgi:hypothetical protein
MLVVLGVVRGGMIPRQAAGQHDLGLQTDVLGFTGRPSLEPREDVREIQAGYPIHGGTG